MAGNTGKMTAEAILARGPRMQLSAVYIGGERIGFFIGCEMEVWVTPNPRLKNSDCRCYARSYSLPYLLRLARAAKEVA